MPGQKLPILTITNRQYFRDSGLYIYSSTDGQLDIIADTTSKVTAPTIELEASTGVTLDGTTTLDTGHYLVFNTDDSVAASGLKAVTAWGVRGGKSMVSAMGWVRVDIGTMHGFVPVYSGCCLKLGHQP